MPFSDDARPSETLIELYEPTYWRLRRFFADFEPIARRRGDKLPSRTTLAIARGILQDVVRLTSRMRGPALLPLWHDDNASLLIRLGQAQLALAELRERYHHYSRLWGEDVWYTREYVEAEAEARAEALANGEPWPPVFEDEEEEAPVSVPAERAADALQEEIYQHAP